MILMMVIMIRSGVAAGHDDFDDNDGVGFRRLS